MVESLDCHTNCSDYLRVSGFFPGRGGGLVVWPWRALRSCGYKSIGAQDSLASSGALLWPSRDPGDGQDPVLKCK